MKDLSDVEEAVQDVFLDWTWFIKFWNIFYGTAHFVVTAGALYWPAARRDWARCGIALYGVDPAGDRDSASGLRPVMSACSAIVAVREIGAGARRDTRPLPVDRRTSGRGSGEVRGEPPAAEPALGTG